MSDLEPYREAPVEPLPPVLLKNFGKTMEQLTVQSLRGGILMPHDLEYWLNGDVIQTIEKAAKSGNFEISISIGRDPTMVEPQIRIWCQQRGLRCSVTTSWRVTFYWGPVKNYSWPVITSVFHAGSIALCAVIMIMSMISGEIGMTLFCIVVAINMAIGLSRSIIDL